MAYRAQQGLTDEPAIAVVVQQMVDSSTSGVMFTVDPALREQLLVEAAFGLGEVVVGGKVEPDIYRFDRETLSLTQFRVGHKSFQIVQNSSGDCVQPLSDHDANRRVLSDQQAAAVARIGMRIEKRYGKPQDVEWAFSDGKLFVLQSRPITTLVESAQLENQTVPSSPTSHMGEPLLTGVGIGSKQVSGTVRVVSVPGAADTLLDGDILVTRFTSPDWLPLLRRAGGLITDTGGSTCHAAIVSRELGIPAVIGSREATRVLRDGDTVTVNGATGEIFRGSSRC